MTTSFVYKPGHPALELHGSLYSESQPGGAVRPYRLPSPTLRKLPVFMKAIVATAAGVRLEFHTEATELQVVLSLHSLDPIGLSDYASAIDVVVAGELIESRAVQAVPHFVNHANHAESEYSDGPDIHHFSGLDPAHKQVEVWLPHNAIVELHEIRANSPLTPTGRSRPRWIHHGSSISHCLEAIRPTRTWPAIAALALGLDLLDLGFAGSAMIDPFVARVIRDQPADLITLKLGINLVNVDLMKMRAFVPAVEGFLDIIRDGHPRTPIVMISPIICPVVESTPGPTASDPDTGAAISLFDGTVTPEHLTLERIRDALAAMIIRRAEHDCFITYLDGRALIDLSDVDEGYLPDGLHPSAEGYELMAERFIHEYRARQRSGCDESATCPR